MFDFLDFEAFWAGVSQVMPHLSDVIAITASFVVAGYFVDLFKKLLNVRSNKEKDKE